MPLSSLGGRDLKLTSVHNSLDPANTELALILFLFHKISSMRVKPLSRSLIPPFCKSATKRPKPSAMVLGADLEGTT